MFANFNKALLNNNQKDTKIPKEVLGSLNEKLPNDLVYVEIEDRKGVVALTSNSSSMEFGGLSFNLNNDVFAEFKPSNVKEVLEFLYRTQRKYTISKDANEYITINGNKFKIDEVIKDPFKENEIGKYDITIYPQPFPEPFKLSFEGKGVKKDITFKRQPFADMHKVLFKNIDNETFSISYVLDERDKHLKFNFSLNLENTKTVEETVEALKLYYAFVSGDIKLNGSELNEYAIKEAEKTSVLETIKFWEKVLELQRRLRVTFIPKSQLEIEDVVLIEKLYRTLIEEKPYKKYINISELTLTGTDDVGKLLGQSGLSMSFHQHDNVKVFGVNLDLYSIICYFDFKVTDIKSSEINKDDVSKSILLVEPVEGRKTYQSSIHFSTEQELKDYEVNNTELQYAEEIIID
ncbi:abortive infection system toxin AbiGii family protein [Bacillus toyonensis]|uniref:abortive infection system toxin AbiGii family protein n=1 Tax=Bacillus toyonensis TaxID=155322 RepID=UPI000CD894FE|nr:abortive infection system toxin AbiGii family protein [Bacillus toyonensis]MED3542296.1 abortive infection system toxin AbiGii family protein [Bacillus toyonensis]MEE2020829.1 abortive infection system toxin AbiGii family protein [Bacillus toyonensis]